MNELEQWNFQNQKLNLEDGILKNCLKIEFRNWKLNLEIGNSKDYLEMGF